jgi:large subunit ribosomal protein L24
MKLRSNDNVMVIKGRDRGKQGRITQAFPKENKVLVEGVNTVMRHTKPTSTMRQAGIIQKELPIPVSNVILICTHCNRPSRLTSRILADGTKARTCKNCEEVIE